MNRSWVRPRKPPRTVRQAVGPHNDVGQAAGLQLLLPHALVLEHACVGPRAGSSRPSRSRQQQTKPVSGWSGKERVAAHQGASRHITVATDSTGQQTAGHTHASLGSPHFQSGTRRAPLPPSSPSLTKQVEDGEGELARALHPRRGGQHKALEAGRAGAYQVAHRHVVRLLRVVAAVPPGGGRGGSTAGGTVRMCADLCQQPWCAGARP